MGELANIASARTLAPAKSSEIQFFDDTGNQIVVTSQDVAKYICPKANEREIVFFMELCRAQRLNPFLNEAFLVKYGQDAQMITAEVVFERRANAHPDFKGIKSGVVYLDADGSICKREGAATYTEAGEKLIGGWANVIRDGREDTYAEIPLREYSKNQSTWKTMPGTMIVKCARAAALRKAFPTDFEGMYMREELQVVPSVAEVAASVVEEDEEQQPSELESAISEIANIRNVDTSDVLAAIAQSQRMQATGYDGSGDMTEIQKSIALEIVNAWIEKATASEPPIEVDADTGEIKEQ